ncbi:protein phosphatase regulator [Neonectria magnoliae]|uniref:Protein phosphatase regulator n=1 Tax=Neonectria magnoliae TaxID=2732573 RepID=A0ABR1H6R6_9HYPO
MDVFYDCSEKPKPESRTGDKATEQDNPATFDTTGDDMPLTIPYEESFEDDDDSDLSFPDDPSYIDSGWAAECLQDTEDIDFEFVYALHTFVATVEGQANATKGDTMVLLDDSNSYWWLVRVVKDSSIGYLPAEHIETPTERLARLNKHRNVDLSATMLGDQAEKKPQTFKTAIRLKRKTVAFAPPTYVDYSDFDDYSTDEEDLDELFAGHTSSTTTTQQQEPKEPQQQQTANAPAEDDAAADESAKVEPLKPRANVEPLKPRLNRDVKLVEPTKVETVIEEDETRNSEEILLDTKLEVPSKSRNGTVRNTDSFFRDDTVETKKITLTPNLLRDDNQPRPSTDSITKDTKARGSLDKLEKELVSDKDKKKKERDRKEKEKKPSAIRSFFSRKDKKKTDDDDESFGKRSMDLQSDSVGRSSESPSLEEQVTEKIQRSPSKLQKQLPRTEPSPTRPGDQAQPSTTMELAAYLNETRTNDVSNVPPATMRIVDAETNETQEVPSHQANASRERSASAAAQRDDKSTAAKDLNRSASTGADSGGQKVNRTKPRMDLDDFSSDEDLELESGTQTTPDVSEEERPKDKDLLRPKLPGAFPDSYESTGGASDRTVTDNKSQQQSRLSESPVEVSPVNGAQPPALEVDTSSLEGRSSEGVPSPEPLHGDETSKDSGSSRSGPSWDDEKLRAFFDESEHVRDLLVVVYDKTNTEPESKDHPVVSGMFREQNAKLAEITTQLDNMLGDWLARKQRLRGTV